jgi:peptidoglycan hydrolase CwlO-like protein
MCRCILTAARTALCGQNSVASPSHSRASCRSNFLTCTSFALRNAATLPRSPLVTSDLDCTETDSTGADTHDIITQQPTPLQQLQAAISKVEASIEKVDGEIDDVKTVLAPGSRRKYLGMNKAESRAYLDKLLVKEQQLRDEKAALLKKEANLLAKRDGAALTATTGECGMARANHIASKDLLKTL